MKTKMQIPSKIRIIAGLSALGLALVAAVTPSYAGPFILAGTDADDHGFVNGSGNQDGWLFMQKALSNIAPGVTNTNKIVYILGSTGSSLTAATSAAAGFVASNPTWSVQTVTTGDFANFFTNSGSGQKLNTAGILMMDSGGNIGGGVAGSSFNTYAAAINTFVGGGGGLFSQANGYSWLGALGLGVTVVSESSTGLALTAAGTTAFPGLNNGDLSAGPYHNRFENVGSLSVFATSVASGNNIIIGAAGGSIINPDPPRTPDGGSFALVYLGLIGLFGAFRRHFGKVSG